MDDGEQFRSRYRSRPGNTRPFVAPSEHTVAKRHEARVQIPENPVSKSTRPKKLRGVVARVDRKYLFFGIVVILIALPTGYFLSHRSKSEISRHPAQLKSISTGRLPQKPAFALYFIKDLPPGLVLDPSSIKYSADEFIFNLKASQTIFYVSEQPVGKGFGFDTFKSKLTSGTDIDTNLGPGVIGSSLNTGLITAVKSKEGTLVIIDCVGGECAAPSKKILENLKQIYSLSDLPR